LKVAPGATVTWQFNGGPHNVTFGVNKPTGGDIGNTSSGSITRTFPSAGVYTYVCTIHQSVGMTGTITVQ
jgi:plastocyanin